MKKKKEPGVFFSNPSEKGATKESSSTIKTFVEGEYEPVSPNNLSEDYARVIDMEYGKEPPDKKKKKKH